MRKRKKTSPTRLLTMDALQARPCEVDGRPALFHRWIEEDRALLKINTLCRLAEELELVRRFHSEGVVEPQCSTEVIRETYALVEYRDGTIDKVKPELIRFIGKEGQHGT
jgi:hypothetical protein